MSFNGAMKNSSLVILHSSTVSLHSSKVSLCSSRVSLQGLMVSLFKNVLMKIWKFELKMEYYEVLNITVYSLI